MGSYRTVIQKANGQAVAPSQKQSSLRDARTTREQRARAKPHLTIVVQTFIDGAWEYYD